MFHCSLLLLLIKLTLFYSLAYSVLEVHVHLFCHIPVPTYEKCKKEAIITDACKYLFFVFPSDSENLQRMLANEIWSQIIIEQPHSQRTCPKAFLWRIWYKAPQIFCQQLWNIFQSYSGLASSLLLPLDRSFFSASFQQAKSLIKCFLLLPQIEKMMLFKVLWQVNNVKVCLLAKGTE